MLLNDPSNKAPRGEEEQRGRKLGGMVGAGHEWAEDGLCLGGETQIVRPGVGKWFEVVQNRHSAAPAFPSLPRADPTAQHRRPLRHKATDDAPAGRKHQLRHQQDGKVGRGQPPSPQLSRKEHSRQCMMPEQVWLRPALQENKACQGGPPHPHSLTLTSAKAVY